jgi:uncharacterized protein with beta-barrel porin domain
MVTVTNNSTGVITGDAFGISANSAIVFNSGTISAPTAGSGGIGLNANTLVLTNFSTGLIIGDAFGVSGGQNPALTITNFGTILATGFAGTAIAGDVVNLVNSGTVSTILGNAVIMTSGSIVNNIGGLISSDSDAIVSSGNTSIFNAGTITSFAGAAIRFFGGGNTLTLAPTSVINGTAHGFGADTFQLGGVGTGSFDASLLLTQFSGYATFNKIDSSTWTLTGTNASAMPWTVEQGTLIVNGNLAHSTMTVDSGAILSGTGTVGSTTVATGGTLAPGSGTPGTSLTVNGNLAFQSGAIYLVQVNPSTASFANVAGSATLGGATVNAVFANGGYISKTYTILIAAGGVNGTFAPTIVNSNLPANFSDTLSYDGTHAFLNLSLNFVPQPAPQAAPNFGGGLSGDQQAVANALINFFNTTGSIPLIFGTLTAAGLTQLDGEVATGTQQTTIDAMSLFMSLLTDPFFGNGSSSVTSPGGVTQYASTSDPQRAMSARERDAYAAIYHKAPPPADTFTQRWSVWAAGFGGSQTTDGNLVVGSNTVTSHIYGGAVGADYHVSPSTLAGFALAGGGTSFTLANALGTGRSDLFQAGVYLRHYQGPAYLTAALAYGWQDTSTDRTVMIAGLNRLDAEFNANAWSGRLEGGYRFALPMTGGLGITPYAAGQFVTFDLPAYAENATVGSNLFALAYGAKSVTDPRSELGVRSDKSFVVQNGVLTLRGRLAWAHDYSTDRNIGATFQTLPGASFVVNGAAQASDSVLTTASAEMKWINGWSAAATFEGEFSHVTASYAGKGVVRYTW